MLASKTTDERNYKMNYQNEMSTNRIELIPLTLEQLKLMKENLKELEKQLNFVYKGEPVQGFVLEYLSEQIRVISEKTESYMYNAFWLIMLKNDRVVVGSGAFKGVPNSDGEIEIGYGLAKEFEHNGYMTEAVGKMCEWGIAQSEVKYIIAETEIDGYASQRVLERNGFTRYRFGDSSWYRVQA